MKHTINYIKKKLHNSKLCRNFLLILTVATLCISALCIPISAENPLTDNTTTYNGFWLSNDEITMEDANNVTKILYDSEALGSLANLPIKCIITNDLNDDYINGNIIIPESLKVYTEKSTKYAPNVYVDINDTTYCIWNADSSYSHNETVIYFLYNTTVQAEYGAIEIFVDESIIDNISYNEFELTQTGILNIFGKIGNWIANAISNVTAMFWANGSLTFIGVLAVGGLGVSIVLLLIRLISSFLAFRG